MDKRIPILDEFRMTEEREEDQAITALDATDLTEGEIVEKIYRFFEHRYGHPFERNPLTHIDINGDFKIGDIAKAIIAARTKKRSEG